MTWGVAEEEARAAGARVAGAREGLKGEAVMAEEERMQAAEEMVRAAAARVVEVRAAARVLAVAARAWAAAARVWAAGGTVVGAVAETVANTGCTCIRPRATMRHTTVCSGAFRCSCSCCLATTGSNAHLGLGTGITKTSTTQAGLLVREASGDTEVAAARAMAVEAMVVVVHQTCEKPTPALALHLTTTQMVMGERLARVGNEHSPYYRRCYESRNP